MFSIQAADINQSSLDTVVHYETNINALTTEYLQEVAKKYLDGGYIKAVLMPEED